MCSASDGMTCQVVHPVKQKQLCAQVVGSRESSKFLIKKVFTLGRTACWKIKNIQPFLIKDCYAVVSVSVRYFLGVYLFKNVKGKEMKNRDVKFQNNYSQAWRRE